MVEGGEIVHVGVTVTMPPAFLCQAILQEHIDLGGNNTVLWEDFLLDAQNGTLNCEVSVMATIDPDDGDFSCLEGETVPQVVIYSHVNMPERNGEPLFIKPMMNLYLHT